MARVADALGFARETLREDSEFPARDAVLLLAHAMGKSASYPHLHPEDPLTYSEASLFEDLVNRRKSGEPVAYLRGYQEFMGLRFLVDKRVLIPRPETEILVESAIADLCGARGSSSHTASLLAAGSTFEDSRSPTGEQTYRIADLCCGSGAIGLSLAKMLPGAQVVLSDCSKDALYVAMENARSLGVLDRAEFLLGDLCRPLLERGMSGTFDLVASNPPYIAHEEMAGLPADVRRFEPEVALDGGLGGLDLIKRLSIEAWPLLKSCGILLVEIGSDQGHACIEAFSRGAHWRPGRILCDYAGRQRVFRVRRA